MSGAVIKAGDARLNPHGGYSLDLRDIAGKADELLAAARAEADSIFAGARNRAAADAASVRRDAEQQGHAKGFEEGRAAGEKTAREAAQKRFALDHAALLSSLSATLAEFDRQKQQFHVAARRDVVLLAVAIASRIAKSFSAMDDIAPQLASDACAEALALVREATDVSVACHPADAAAIEEVTPEMSRALKSAAHIRVVHDSTVQRGGVSVSTSDTRVDASINQRIERIAGELVENWRHRLAELNVEP